MLAFASSCDFIDSFLVSKEECGVPCSANESGSSISDSVALKEVVPTTRSCHPPEEPHEDDSLLVAQICGPLSQRLLKEDTRIGVFCA